MKRILIISILFGLIQFASSQSFIETNSSMSPLFNQDYTELYKAGVDANFFGKVEGDLNFKANLIAFRKLFNKKAVEYYNSSKLDKSNRLFSSINIGCAMKLNDDANNVTSFIPSISFFLPNRNSPQYDEDFLENKLLNGESYNSLIDGINKNRDKYSIYWKQQEGIKFSEKITKQEKSIQQLRDSIKLLDSVKLTLDSKEKNYLQTKFLFEQIINSLNSKLESETKIKSSLIEDSSKYMNKNLEITKEKMKLFLWITEKNEIIANSLAVLQDLAEKDYNYEEYLKHLKTIGVDSLKNFKHYDPTNENKKYNYYNEYIIIDKTIDKLYKQYIDSENYKKQKLAELTTAYLRKPILFMNFALPFEKGLRGFEWQSKFTYGLFKNKLNKEGLDFFFENMLSFKDTTLNEEKKLNSRVENIMTFGISKIVLSTNKTNDDNIVYKDPLIELRFQAEWNRILKGVLEEEDKTKFFLGVIANFRIAKDLWFPITMKYKFGDDNKTSFQPGIGINWNMTTSRKFSLE